MADGDISQDDFDSLKEAVSDLAEQIKVSRIHLPK